LYLELYERYILLIIIKKFILKTVLCLYVFMRVILISWYLVSFSQNAILSSLGKHRDCVVINHRRLVTIFWVSTSCIQGYNTKYLNIHLAVRKAVMWTKVQDFALMHYNNQWLHIILNAFYFYFISDNYWK